MTAAIRSTILAAAADAWFGGDSARFERTPVTGVLRPQARFGDYTLLRPLAAGGMAEIHLARTRRNGHDTLVVLKRILPEYASDHRMTQMFLDEAAIVASLQHPNIALIYDLGRTMGKFYLAMEYLRGVNMNELINRLVVTRRPLSLRHVLTMIVGACSGLHHAHERRDEHGIPLGIVHRDVSPQNIFITYDGIPKVVDFGIAKASTRFTHTRPGAMMGKPSYMSPEQCLARPMDRRGDIFSMSIILWELTTGRRLYRGRSELEVMKRIVEKNAPAPKTVEPSVPSRLSEIISKGLRRNPDERYQTIDQLRCALTSFAAAANIEISQTALSGFLKDVVPDNATIDELGGGAALADRFLAKPDTGYPECIVVSTASVAAEPPLSHDRTDEVAPLRTHNRVRTRLIAMVALCMLVLITVLALTTS